MGTGKIMKPKIQKKISLIEGLFFFHKFNPKIVSMCVHKNDYKTK